jgi:glutamyl-tRNA synthetase
MYDASRDGTVPACFIISGGKSDAAAQERMPMRKGRYAPTPSGQLHLGNARTALLAWLQMRSVGGSFVLRIEDVDRTRARDAYRELIIRDLRWLGLDWDEGPDVGGPHAPYIQSEREDRYEAALQHLIRQGRIYPCFCSRADIQSMARAPHGLASEGPFYDGRCRKLTAEQRQARAAVKTPSLRFIVPDEGTVSFTDGVFGPQQFPANYGGDFVVKRADHMYAYQLAVVVDDEAMGITDVLRGADLLDSTPRQLHLYAALGHEPPAFAHVPLVLGPDGRRLSKSHGDIAISSLREAGVRPETIVGWLAYLSGLIDQPEAVRPGELLHGFHLQRIPREPVRIPETLLRDWTSQT